MSKSGCIKICLNIKIGFDILSRLDKCSASYPHSLNLDPRIVDRVAQCSARRVGPGTIFV